MMKTKEFLENHKNAVIDEAAFENLLHCMQEDQLTRAALQQDHWLYEDVSAMTIQYLLTSGFCGKNKKLLTVIHSDMFCAACSVGMNLLLSMDRILECDSGIMRFVQTLVNRRVIDLARQYSHAYPIMPDETGINQPILLSLSSEMCALIEDDSIPGADAFLMEKETREEQHCKLLMILPYFKRLSRFEATSLLATKVLDLRPHKLAELIDNYGLLPVSFLIIKLSDKVLHTNRIPTVFANNDTPAYASSESLSLLITRASNRAQTRICRFYGMLRPVKHSVKVPEPANQVKPGSKAPLSGNPLES